MYIDFLIYSVVLSTVLSEPFFHFADKPIFFCFKVCPLYCSPRRRRSVEDASSLIYLEDDPYSFSPDVWIEDSPVHSPYHFGHFVFCKPKPTTTTTTTTAKPMPTTTEEPTWICMVCKAKCDYPKS